MFGSGDPGAGFGKEDVKGVIKKKWPTFVLIGIIVFAIFMVVLLGILYNFDLAGIGDSKSVENKKFEEYMSTNKMYVTLQAFQDIAANFNGSRAMNLGYNSSAEYVEDQLKKYTPFDVTVQTVPVITVEELAQAEFSQVFPEQVDYVYGKDFISVEYLGSGDITAKLYLIERNGCEDADWANFPADMIALVWYRSGTCRYRDIANLASKYGAGGCIVANSANGGGLLFGSAKNPMNYPMISVTWAIGTELEELINYEIENNGTGVEVKLFSSTRNITNITSNIMACTLNGLASQTIIVGSHLDSVPAGPGINDNGSGSAVNLELAMLWAERKVVEKNRVCFAWWAAEELGLKGSTYWVSQRLASPEGLKDIALNINMDMVGSPNFFRGIYNGREAPDGIRNQSNAITSLFEQFFTGKDLAYEMTPFDGRSDYGPFIENGVPASGLFTGAESIKSVTQRTLYGGAAETAYDPCYHKACDTIDNINREVFQEMAQACASVVYDLAMEADLQDFLNTYAPVIDQKFAPVQRDIQLNQQHTHIHEDFFTTM